MFWFQDMEKSNCIDLKTFPLLDSFQSDRGDIQLLGWKPPIYVHGGETCMQPPRQDMPTGAMTVTGVANCFLTRFQDGSTEDDLCLAL